MLSVAVPSNSILTPVVAPAAVFTVPSVSTLYPANVGALKAVAPFATLAVTPVSFKAFNTSFCLCASSASAGAVNVTFNVAFVFAAGVALAVTAPAAAVNSP